MDYPPGWTFPLPDAMYDANNPNNPFSTNVSSLFRRPSKVVKPRSRNSSPKHGTRRRTNSTAPVSRTRSVVDRQRASVPHYSTPTEQPQPRPSSWHPMSYVDFSNPSQEMLQMTLYEQYPQFNPYITSTVNGLVTPLSYPIMDEPQIQELITPLSELTAQEGGQNYGSGYGDNQFWFQSGMPKQQQYTMDAMFQQTTQFPQNWAWNPYADTDVPTAPPSPDFLPIQGGVETSPLTLNSHKVQGSSDGEELVGMGLYDSPAQVQSSSFLLSGVSPIVAARKSLKLEDSFEPATEEDDAEHEEDNEEVSNDDVDTDENDLLGDVHNNEAQNVPVYPEQFITPMPNLAGQSFFFEQEPDPTMLQYAAATNYMSNDLYSMTYPSYAWV